MRIDLKLDPECEETKVLITTRKMDEEVEQLINRLEMVSPKLLIGYREEAAMPLQPRDIFRFYAANQKIYAVTEKGEYIVRKRLYELETMLDQRKFVRISNSDIINIQKIEQFDLSLSGTICVRLKNKEAVYVSRRYVTQIKKLLDL